MDKPRDYDGAELLGWQDDGNGSGFWLYNLTAPIPGHPVGSTVAESTLARSSKLDADALPVS